MDESQRAIEVHHLGCIDRGEALADRVRDDIRGQGTVGIPWSEAHARDIVVWTAPIQSTVVPAFAGPMGSASLRRNADPLTVASTGGQHEETRGCRRRRSALAAPVRRVVAGPRAPAG